MNRYRRIRIRLTQFPTAAAIARGRYSLGRFYLRRYGQFDEQPGVGLALYEEGLKVFDEGVGEPVPAAAARLSMCAWSAR